MPDETSVYTLVGGPKDGTALTGILGHELQIPFLTPQGLYMHVYVRSTGNRFLYSKTEPG